LSELQRLEIEIEIEIENKNENENEKKNKNKNRNKSKITALQFTTRTGPPNETVDTIVQNYNRFPVHRTIGKR